MGNQSMDNLELFSEPHRPPEIIRVADDDWVVEYSADGGLWRRRFLSKVGAQMFIKHHLGGAQ